MNISQRLRTCAKHTGLDAVIELLQEAADEIDALQARAQVQGDPSWWTRETDEGAEWTDTAPLVLSGWTPLYTAPQAGQVPMTDEQRNDLICTVTTLGAKLSRRDLVGTAIDWTEAHHGITAQAKGEQ